MAGSKEQLFLTRTGVDGTEYRLPAGIIHGAQPGRQITIYAGQHGTEYDGIEAAQRLFRETNPDDVNGRLVIGLVVNEASFTGWTQFAPTAVEISEMMMQLAEGSTALINCHGGEFSEGMCPYVICRLLGRPDVDALALEMAEHFGVPYISLSEYRGEPPQDDSGARPAWWLWPSKSMADVLQLPEITPEVGQRGSRDDQHIMFDGIVNVLRKLGVLAGEAVEPEAKPRVIGERYWLTAQQPGLFFPEVDICQDVTAGQRLGVVRDYFGNVVHEVVAPAAAKVMNLNCGMPVEKDGFLLWLGEV